MARQIPGDWHSGFLPDNAVIHERAHIESSISFEAYRSRLPVGFEIGEGSAIYAGSQMDAGPAGRIVLGTCVLLNGCLIIADELVEIGDYSMIAWLVTISDAPFHPATAEGRRECLRAAAHDRSRRLPRSGPSRPVRIGRNVWIGFESCIMPGVTIGDGSIVGARSVVYESIPAYSVAAGNPARIIRRLQPAEIADV
jgi:acetyltransferase-like isoleucine patch superfamily enzyme